LPLPFVLPLPFRQSVLVINYIALLVGDGVSPVPSGLCVNRYYELAVPSQNEGSLETLECHWDYFFFTIFGVLEKEGVMNLDKKLNTVGAEEVEEANVDFICGHGLRGIGDGFTDRGVLGRASPKETPAAEQRSDRSFFLEQGLDLGVPFLNAGKAAEVPVLKVLN
jgi:hypothetical protein